MTHVVKFICVRAVCVARVVHVPASDSDVAVAVGSSHGNGDRKESIDHGGRPYAYGAGHWP